MLSDNPTLDRLIVSRLPPTGRATVATVSRAGRAIANDVASTHLAAAAPLLWRIVDLMVQAYDADAPLVTGLDAYFVNVFVYDFVLRAGFDGDAAIEYHRGYAPSQVDVLLDIHKVLALNDRGRRATDAELRRQFIECGAMKTANCYVTVMDMALNEVVVCTDDEVTVSGPVTELNLPLLAKLHHAMAQVRDAARLAAPLRGGRKRRQAGR